MNALWKLGWVVVAGVLLGLLPACGGGGGSGGSRVRGDDSLLIARRADVPAGERVRAIKLAEAQVESGQAERLVMRYAMKEMAWALDTPEMVRAAALEAVLWDEEAEEDSRDLVREMLPTEPDRGPVAVMATAIVDHEWFELTPALVRSLARPVVGVADQERAEYQALEQLYPGRPLDRVAFEVFLDPRTKPGPAGLRLDMRVREAAWDLIGRLTPERKRRASLLDTAISGDDEGVVIFGKLQEVRDQLGVVPERGEEVRWALRLVEERNGRLATWWEQTARAVGQVLPEGRAGLALRHIEAVRWAGQEQPEWLGMGREGLLGELAGRLKGRQVYSRTESIRGLANANRERLATARESLVWGDVLVLLVIDEALAEPSVREALFAAAEIDHKDNSSEHGGTLWADATGFHARHFPPRGSAAPDDRRFVAPREMIDYSGAALAHFHFHVTDWRNRDYAGPSPGDLDYAARFGRVCVVFSGLGRGKLNADVYFPNGAVVDLGEIRRADPVP